MAVVLALDGCGFKLRGSADLPFATLYTDFSGGASLAGEFRRTLQARGGTRLVADPKDAEAVLQILFERLDKDVLAFTGIGRPAEYRLRFVVSFRVFVPGGRELASPSTIELSRDFTAPEFTYGGEAGEEMLLFRDMRADMINQILRRLAAIRA